MKNNKQPKSQLDMEWENRTLCSDESCIGVIGIDGRCKECGKPFNQEPEKERSDMSEESDNEDRLFEDDSSFEDDYSTVHEEMEWENRTLCSDESCIGVIGTDGRCKECGKPFENA